MKFTRRGLIVGALAGVVARRRRRPAMPFPTPPTSSITLPTGATSGPRIVIDGASDTITVYDANNVPVIQINANFTVTSPVFGGPISGPTITLQPDAAPAPQPWTQLGFLTADVGGSGLGIVVLSAPSLDPAKNNQATLELDSGTAAAAGADSGAAIVTGRQGEIALDSGGIVFRTHNDLWPDAIDSNNFLHNVAVGEWATVPVTVTAGNSSGTAVFSFNQVYNNSPKIIGFLNSGSGSAIRATAFCSAKSNFQATIRVDTNAALGATTTFNVDVLVLSAG